MTSEADEVNNTDADIRAEFEEFYWNKYGEGIFVGVQNVRQRLFAKDHYNKYQEDQLNRELDIYTAGIEQGKRIEREENEKTIRYQITRKD